MKSRQRIPVIADALPEAQVLPNDVRTVVPGRPVAYHNEPIAARVARTVATGDVTLTLDAEDCIVVGHSLRMLARNAPQPDVAERLQRVGDALVEAGWRKA